MWKNLLKLKQTYTSKPSFNSIKILGQKKNITIKGFWYTQVNLIDFNTNLIRKQGKIIPQFNFVIHPLFLIN